MKNLDRIYGLSKSQILLEELTSTMNLDYYIRSQSNQLLSMYKEKNPNWTETDSDYIVRIAIFITSKLKHTGVDTTSLITLSSILKEIPSLQIFMVKLKEFVTSTALDARIKSDIQSIISSYAFSITLYNKYEELWSNIGLPQNEEIISVKKIGWTMFLLSRVNLIQRRSEIVECACMLVAVIYTLLTTCEINSFLKYRDNEVDCLNSLSSMIKGQAEQIRISATHLKKMLELFIQHRIVQSDSGVPGLFHQERIVFNSEKLYLEYVHKLLPSEFDQTQFIEGIECGLCQCNYAIKFIVKSSLNYDFQCGSPSSAVAELVLRPKEYSSGQNLDCEAWINVYTQDTSNEALLNASLHGISSNEKLNSLINCRGPLFSMLFTRLVKNSCLGSEEANQRIAAVLAVEIFKVAFSAKSLSSIEELINLCQTCPYGVWKCMRNFSDQEIPKALYLHLKEQEIIIMTSLAWQDKRFLMQFKTYLSSKKENQLEMKIFTQEMFFYCNFAIKEICRALNISEKLQEEIWALFKSCVTTESDMLLNRDLHQIMMCSIYGLCKAKNLNVTFNSIISRVTDIDPLSESIFRKIQIDDSVGDIIKYYNDEFLKYMKSYLLTISRTNVKEIYSNPLGISNAAFDAPGVSFSDQSPNMIFSPYFTSSARKYYEFGESPVESLNSFNHMISRNSNRNFLDFDEEKIGQPIKRPKLVDEIFQGEDTVENLPEEFPGFKDE